MTGSVRQRLSAHLTGASKADRAIAAYMQSEMNRLPFETAASIATKVGVSEATVGRFCRSLGYKSLRDLKNHLSHDIGDRPWLIADRLREFEDRARSGEDELAQSLKLEMAALVAVYELARTPQWVTIVKRIAHAPAVFATGFQTERGMAQIFCNQLQYLRDRVHLIDLAGGNFVEVLASNTYDKNNPPCLILFEARRYSRMAELLAHDAKRAGLTVILITDPFCDWGRQIADDMLVVPTEFNLFWESSAQMASLANLLVNGVFLELGHAVEARMNEVTRLYARYTGYVGDGPSTSSDT
jgi:DNA-binding MurR/RpiR family transcriptional regulator